MVTSFEERRDASEPVSVVPHHSVLRARLVVRHTKSVLEDCDACQYLFFVIIRQHTIETFLASLEEEVLLVAGVGDVSREVPDLALAVFFGWFDVEQSVLSSQVLLLPWSEGNGLIRHLEREVNSLSSGWSSVEDNVIFGTFLPSDGRRRTGRA